MITHKIWAVDIDWKRLFLFKDDAHKERWEYFWSWKRYVFTDDRIKWSIDKDIWIDKWYSEDISQLIWLSVNIEDGKIQSILYLHEDESTTQSIYAEYKFTFSTQDQETIVDVTAPPLVRRKELELMSKYIKETLYIMDK